VTRESRKPAHPVLAAMLLVELEASMVGSVDAGASRMNCVKLALQARHINTNPGNAKTAFKINCLLG